MQKLSRWLFKLLGWQLVGSLPDRKKYIIIAAPHTSNWDLIICLIARASLAVKVEFFAKSQLFVFPFNYLFKALGGTPVERTHHHNLVDAAVKLFHARDSLILGLAPEGTRSPVKRWKYGFYHIAHNANVPIVMLGLDYASKALRISEPFWTSGDIEADFAKIIAYFRQMKGRHPKKIPDFNPNDSE
jgi:1-acyl-sn-glycerol-3-phosphate acyltransferase